MVVWFLRIHASVARNACLYWIFCSGVCMDIRVRVLITSFYDINIQRWLRAFIIFIFLIRFTSFWRSLNCDQAAGGGVVFKIRDHSQITFPSSSSSSSPPPSPPVWWLLLNSQILSPCWSRPTQTSTWFSSAQWHTHAHIYCACTHRLCVTQTWQNLHTDVHFISNFNIILSIHVPYCQKTKGFLTYHYISKGKCYIL